MRQVLRVLIFICLLSGGVGSAIVRGQQPEQFRTAFGGFGVNLPQKYSEYKSASLDVANYRFPVRVYRWKSDRDSFTITAGEGANDLEKPEYTKLFLDDFRRQYAELSAKQNGVIISEGPWSHEGHPGWQIVERRDSTAINLRFFVIRYRFYTISVAASDGEGINETRQNILNSFHLLSPAEIAAEKERLIESFAPSPLPQQPAITRPLSDAQEQNLRGKVKRVYVEAADYLGRPQPISRHPRTREDFDQNGYLISRIEYLDFMPYKAFSFGYTNGTRAYLLSERSSLLEQSVATGPATPQAPELYEEEHKFGKTGLLEEVKVSGEKGKVQQIYSYQDKEGRREIAFREKNRYARNISLQWKSVIELDKDGNPASETTVEYFDSPTGKVTSTERQVDTHAVVTNAIRGETIISPNGTGRPPSVAEIAKNPNMTTRVYQPSDAGTPQRRTETRYTYSYEYDAQGNWTKRVQYLMKKSDKSYTAVPMTVTYRTITYY